jgi:hypothetical protein
LRRFEKGHCSRAFHQLCRHLKTGQLMVSHPVVNET